MAYFGRRLVHMLIVLWAIATILFLLFRLMPGDPTIAQLDPTFTEEQRQMVKAQFGLDRPLAEQYLIYMRNLVQGEF
jgi:peptide/nickel transport system permease protein